jgi:hypothetical protein
MGFDLFQSRRNQNEFCRWWSRNESSDYEEDVLIYKQIPSGSFYAKEISAEVQDDNIVAGVFFAEKNSITIMSSDDLTSLFNSKQDIRNKVLVEYQNEIWRVDNVQKRKARIQNSEFGRVNNISHYWYLSLIKG